MRPQLVRLVDYWLGVPLCSLLTALRVVLPSHRRPTRKIVFLKFIEQGATVLAYDALERAAAWVGRENVFFCVFTGNRAILDVLGSIPHENIIVVPDDDLWTCLLGFVRALRKLRRDGIDTTIDLEFFSRASAVFAFLSGATTRVGLHRFTSELPYRGDLMTHRVQYSPYQHVAVQYALLVEAASQDPAEQPLTKMALPVSRPLLPRFAPTESDRAVVRMRLQQDGGEPTATVLLNPNASDLLPLRKWPEDRFVELGRRILAAHPGALVVLTGASSEQAAADQLASRIGSSRVVSMAGRTTMRELLTLYSMADVLVTNDSGPGHFSALTPVRTVVLFGPETPMLFGPLSPDAAVVWKGLSCSPCVSVFNHRFSPCRDNVCMQAIGVDEVFAAVEKSLEDRRPEP